MAAQGYLAHEKTPTPLGPPEDCRHMPTEGSWGGAIPYERGTPVLDVGFQACLSRSALGGGGVWCVGMGVYKRCEDLFLNPMPDYGAILSNCSEFTRARMVSRAVFLSGLICPMAISKILTGLKSCHFPLGPNFNWPEKT